MRFFSYTESDPTQPWGPPPPELFAEAKEVSVVRQVFGPDDFEG